MYRSYFKVLLYLVRVPCNKFYMYRYRVTGYYAVCANYQYQVH